ncbi:MAG: hypothetical protein K2M03_01660 [Muribaculaceae bacterium]|nr:hypothetical protein [Muribaculaceae bacterium]
MEVNHKLTIDIFGTDKYDTDAVPKLMIKKLRCNPNFKNVSSMTDNRFLIGTINNKKIAVICGKEVSYDTFTDWVNKADIEEECLMIFANTPQHGKRYDFLKDFVHYRGYYFVETSPMFMKIETGFPVNPPFQDFLIEQYAEMLLKLI